MMRSAAALTAALLVAMLAGCSSQCDRHPDEPPVVFTDGTVDPVTHVYMSSPNAENPWEGPWLDFPPGRTYRLVHHLGGVPRKIEYYFAFSAHPITPENGSSSTGGFVLGAGNQGTVQVVDADHVDIRNDTCSDVFLMVLLADPRLESTDAGVTD
jgi:hypothetical protein